MFLLVSPHPEFITLWRDILGHRGESFSVAELSTLNSRREDETAQLIVIDYCLLEGMPVSVLQSLRTPGRHSHLLLGATTFDPQRELAALAAGVVACCDVALSHADLERIVEIVLHGGVWISRDTIPLLAGKLHEAAARQPPRAVAPHRLAELTQRQREVAEMVCQGDSNKTIARRLDITDRTVKAHLTSIFEKLGVTDRLQLALYLTKHPV